MLNFSEITINDKAYFDEHIKLYNPQISELTFTNLFMWRNFYNFRYTEIEGLLCIVAVPQGSAPFAYFPLGNINEDTLKKTVTDLKSYFRNNGWQLEFKRVGEAEQALFKVIGVKEEDFSHDRNNCDYVYMTTDLINLKGKKFDGKRNHINRFKRENTFEYVSLNGSHIDECRKITRHWCKERSCEHHKDLFCEKVANFEVLNNYSALGCKGALIKLDGEYKAFTVGEMLNNDTAVIHIEKADGSINGLYTIINQQFCEREWKDTAFINREQDLGVEGIRKAKLSYNPVKMINKYNLIIN